MSHRDKLLRALADGRFHSGQAIAAALGVSRTAVWKQVRRLEDELSIRVDAVRGRGYRLPTAIELLDPVRILAEVPESTRRHLDLLHVLTLTASTNACAQRDPPLQAQAARVWLAEHQTGGRGRRGRAWRSAFSGNLYLSFAWRFDLPMAELSGLSLAGGVALAEMLRDQGLQSHALKWPNDVLIDERKLAGILVEVSGEAHGPSTAVIGIGLNVRLPADTGRLIDQPWIDLESTGIGAVSRNRLAGQLVARLIETCLEFQQARLQGFVERWGQFDAYADRQVRLTGPAGVVEGVYRGISAAGAVILDTPAGRCEHRAGEVSLRPGPG
jgi:BirA family biotin operon repressor/biotin-[acetyl-CoA-carboxylase] ligase